jgi:hypothetical protein
MPRPSAFSRAKAGITGIAGGAGSAGGIVVLFDEAA